MPPKRKASSENKRSKAKKQRIEDESKIAKMLESKKGKIWCLMFEPNVLYPGEITDINKEKAKFTVTWKRKNGEANYTHYKFSNTKQIEEAQEVTKSNFETQYLNARVSGEANMNAVELDDWNNHWLRAGETLGVSESKLQDIIKPKEEDSDEEEETEETENDGSIEIKKRREKLRLEPYEYSKADTKTLIDIYSNELYSRFKKFNIVHKSSEDEFKVLSLKDKKEKLKAVGDLLEAFMKDEASGYTAAAKLSAKEPVLARVATQAAFDLKNRSVKVKSNYEAEQFVTIRWLFELFRANSMITQCNESVEFGADYDASFSPFLYVSSKTSVKENKDPLVIAEAQHDTFTIDNDSVAINTNAAFVKLAASRCVLGPRVANTSHFMQFYKASKETLHRMVKLGLLISNSEILVMPSSIVVEDTEEAKKKRYISHSKTAVWRFGLDKAEDIAKLVVLLDEFVRDSQQTLSALKKEHESSKEALVLYP